MPEPVRYSRLRLMAQSPAHYLANSVEQTACMEKGSAVDYLVFCTKQVIAYPGKVRNGKEWESFKLDHPENEFLVVTKAENEEARAIAKAVRSNKLAMSVLDGERQREVFWKFCGRDCVSHLDVSGAGFVSELKVSQTSNPLRFRWHALKMHYHAQLGFYKHAVEQVDGEPVRSCHIVCVEAYYPHVVTVYTVQPRAVEAGQKLCRLWMERLLQCEAEDFWPGYSQCMVDLDVPDDDEWSIG